MKISDTDAQALLDAWIAEIDKLVLARYGFSVHDLPDQPFSDWYEDGITPEQCIALIDDFEGF